MPRESGRERPKDWDWDAAAGHALVVAAGGRMQAPDGGALVYGTAELIVPGFIASGAR